MMKSLSFAAAALAVGHVAALPSSRANDMVDQLYQLERMGKLDKRQMGSVGAMVNSVMNPGYGKVAAPANAGPTKLEVTTRTKIPGAKTITMKYGPYKVPNMKFKNVIGEEGALWNYADVKADKPCDECTIVGMNAGLEYLDGKNANIDTGMWLHHMVLLNIGPGRSDATCVGAENPLGISAPHLLLGASASNSERLFSSGNERTKAIMPAWNEDNVGYKLKKTDKFALIVDLMNENMEDKQVYMTLTFDVVPGNPKEYDDMKPVWFDVAQCLTSEWPPPYEVGNYTVPSRVWTANFNGDIIGAAGHLHDGGQRVILEVDGKEACNSEATYGGSPEFIQKTAMGHADGSLAHISQMSLCIGDKFKQKKLIKGQKWKLRADYDYGRNKGDKHGNGKQSNVMGIAIMYVRIKN